MNFVIKNIKKVGIFNSILLVVSLVSTIYAMSVSVLSPVYFAFYLLCIASIISAFVYATKGYKKDAAKYYKAYFLLYGLCTLTSVVSAVSATIQGDFLKVYTNEIILALVAIDALVLALGKNLGEKKSTGLALALLVLQFISSIRIFIVYSGNTLLYITYFTRIVLACIACTFVAAKYADKEARGTK